MSVKVREVDDDGAKSYPKAENVRLSCLPSAYSQVKQGSNCCSKVYLASSTTHNKQLGYVSLDKIINTTLLWCLFVWQNPKSQLKESMLMFLLKLRSLYKCLKLDSKPNVCWDLIRFKFWKVDQSVPGFILDCTISSLLICSSNRKRGNDEIVKRIEGIKSVELKTGNWIFDVHFFVIPGPRPR